MVNHAANLIIGATAITMLVISAYAEPAPIPLARPDRGGITAIVNAAQVNNVPVDFAVSIAFAESKFNCRATSKAGARGIAQVMPATATEMGYEPDALHSCAVGASAGMQYLRKMLDRCADDFACAAAKYNAGPNRIDMPAETRHYVATVMAGLS